MTSMNKYFRRFACIQIAIAYAREPARDDTDVEVPVPVVYAPTQAPIPVTPPPLYPVAPVPGGHVCLYRKEHYQGYPTCFEWEDVGKTLCKEETKECNAQIKSVKFGSGVEYLKLFEHPNFKNYLGNFTGDQPVLAAKWRVAKSFRMYPPDYSAISATEVCLYKETEFQGERICVDVATTGTFGFHPLYRKVRSVKFGSDVDLFQMWETYTRLAYKYLGSISSSQTKLDSKFHSFYKWRAIQKAPANQVCCYKTPYFEGSRTCFSKGDHDFVGDALNDKIQSIRFGAGVSGIGVYKHRGFKDSIGTYTQSMVYLSDTEDDMSSLKVF